MRIRLAALAAAAGLAAAVVPAHAAAAKPQITDATGDANGINQQFPGLGPTPPQTSTAPADLASADITSVLFQTVFVTKKVKGKTVKVPNGFTITLNLAAAPAANVFYRVSGNAGDCTGVSFEYDNNPANAGFGAWCPALPTPGSTQTNYAVTGKVSGTQVIWTVPNGVFKNGTTFSSLNAQTRLSWVAAVVPQIDYAQSSATYKVGK